MVSVMAEDSVEFEDSYGDLPEYDTEDYEEDYEEELDNEPVSRNPRSQPRVDLTTALEDAHAEIAELKKRMGDQLRISGEKHKEELAARDREIDEWLDKINPFIAQEAASARDTGFAEGVRWVEERLLRNALPEERVAYLEEVRKVSPKASPQQPAQLETRRKTNVSGEADINTLVEQYVAQGVPLDQLEQTSAEAVVRSGAKYFADQLREMRDQMASLDNKLETRSREASGATRVSSGSGPAVRPMRSTDAKRLEEIDAELKRLKGRGNQERGGQLLMEKREIEERLRRRPAR